MNTVATVFTRTLPLLIAFSAFAQQSPLVYSGGHGPGRGKQVVLIAGDQEYRSEESIPALAQILAVRHGFHCTVLFSVNRQARSTPTPSTISPASRRCATRIWWSSSRAGWNCPERSPRVVYVVAPAKLPYSGRFAILTRFPAET